MHIGSLDKMKKFVDKYLAAYREKPLKILDLGSQDVNGSYKQFFSFPAWSYTGVDMVSGNNVDVVLQDVYNWKEFQNASYDVLISGQVFEHVEYFWVSIMEIARVLKEGGICCLIAPSNGVEHRYPVDCWRYYPDGFQALAKYAGLEVIEAYTQWQNTGYPDGSDIWHDSVLICQKPRLSVAEKEERDHRTVLAKLVAGTKVEPESLANALKYYETKNNVEQVAGTGLPSDTSTWTVEKIQEVSQLDPEIILSQVRGNLEEISLLNQIAVYNFNNGSVENVIPYLQRALEIDECHADTLFNLASVLLEMGERDLAASYLEKIEDKDQDVLGILQQLRSEESLKKKDKIFLDPSCDVRGSDKILFGSGVVVQKDCWLNIAYNNPNQKYIIELGDGTNIGRRSTISAANKIVLGKRVLIGPNVFIADTSHRYDSIGTPIMDQGITTISNEIHIGDGSWIGSNSVIIGDVRIGKGSVIGANSVVNKDIPDYAVAVGSPAEVVKLLDIETGKWVKVKDDKHLKTILDNRGTLANFILPFQMLKSLQVEVSSSCNLQCPQCFNRIEGHKKGLFSKRLWDQKIKPVLSQLHDIHLVGIGEPLLCPDFFDFMEDSVKHNVTVHTTSNLQLVTEEMAEKLVTCGLKFLSFSCDGSTKETYEKIRVNGSFEKLKHSLELINKFKSKHKSSFPKLTLNFGALRSNIHELPDVIRFAHTYCVETVIAYHDVIYREDLKEQSLYHDQLLSDTKFVEADEVARNLGVNVFFPGLFSEPNQNKGQGIYCGYPFQHLLISSDGTVGPCCMDFPDRIYLGNIEDSSIEEVWNRKEILSLRRELGIRQPCHTCLHCVNHGKLDISDGKSLFRFEGSDQYLKILGKNTQ